MFLQQYCPYCVAALQHMDSLFAEDPKYKALEIEKIDELVHPDIAKKYGYYYVPTYYIGDKKMHEGAASLKDVRRVFDAALKT